MNINSIWDRLRPDPDFTAFSEKVKSGISGAVGIFLLGLALKYFPQFHYPTAMLASMAASAVLLYAAQHSPMAQPWPLIGGHFVSAVCGWLAAQFITDPVGAAAVAVGGAIFSMSLTRSLHPPGAATALIMVLNYGTYHEFGWQWAGYVVALNALISLLAALAVNNLMPGRYYPAKKPVCRRPDIQPAVPLINREDIEVALAEMGGIIDVSEDDLLSIYRIAVKNASRRVAGQAL